MKDVQAPSILFLTSFSFHPPYEGSSARLSALIRYFRSRMWSCRVAYCDIGRGVLPNYSGMSRRCDGLSVYKPTSGEIAERQYGSCDSWCPDGFARLVARICRCWPIDIVIAQFVYLTKCFTFLGRDRHALRVVDADNLYTDRVRHFEPIGLPYISFSTNREDEVRALSRADLLVAIQPDEAREISKMVPGRPLIVVPHADRGPVCGGFSTGPDILYVGSRTIANVDGIRRFIEVAFPRIRVKIPDVRLRVAGAVGEAIANEVEGVEILGVVDDIDELYRQAAIVINPARVGTGLSIKSLEALVRGKCLVTTSAGARGIAEIYDCGIVVPSIVDFAPIIIELLSNLPEIRRCEQHASRIVRPRYSPDRVFGGFERVLSDLLSTNRMLGH
jgi:glycosyltransferase involved in cell wall biosynthesis